MNNYYSDCQVAEVVWLRVPARRPAGDQQPNSTIQRGLDEFLETVMKIMSVPPGLADDDEQKKLIICVWGKFRSGFQQPVLNKEKELM